MTLLKRRIEKLESSVPKEDLVSHLSDDELDEQMYLTCKVLLEQGVELNQNVGLASIRCRELFNDEPWLKDVSHRLSVFLRFREIGFDRKMSKRIEDIFALGWRNYKIDKDDIAWIVDRLKGVDLGKETPWLKGYLQHSGVS